MTFIDFFAGIGGFRLGMEMAGHECLGHCEIDKYADKSYRAIHNIKENEWYANDICRVEPDELPEADCYCGGFPCQAFSIAGKRGGFEDTRGTLFFEVMRIARVRKPKYLFLENVKGLLSHDRGRTFGTIIQTLAECGYDAEWQVCNSKNYGVPQNRERVFIIGHLRGESGGQVFPVGQGGGKDYVLSGQVAGTITRRSGENQTVGSYVIESEQHAQINKASPLVDLIVIRKPTDYVYYGISDGDFIGNFQFDVAGVRNINYSLEDIRNRNTVTSRMANFGLIVDKDSFTLENAKTALVGTRFNYRLKTPETIPLDYEEIKTHYPFTQFYTTGSPIEPDLEVTVKTTI